MEHENHSNSTTTNTAIIPPTEEPSVQRVLFNLGETLYPQDARKYVACLLNDGNPEHKELLSPLMNYQSDGKTTITGFPAIQFDYYRRGFALVAFTEQGRDTLTKVLPLLHQKIAADKGSIVRVSSHELALGVKRIPYMKKYKVANMCVEKRGDHKTMLMDPELGQKHVERLFLDSIRRQAEAAGITLPGNLKVSFAGAERVKYGYHLRNARVASGSRVGLRCLVNAYFEVNLDLSGIWSVGYHLGAGLGKFNADIQKGGRQ